MDFTLNGKPVSVEVREGASLLEVLREGCGVTSVKDGCAPEGSCGACTVMVEGRAVVSCAQRASRFASKQVVTPEGLAATERERWAAGFVAAGASQCGFCSPGIVMKAESLLAKDPDPSREQIAKALAGNLCRCTGYVKIVDAIRLVAAARRGEPLPEIDRSGRVGSRTARYQGGELALGDKPYVNDMTVPGMLHGAVRLSDHPRARVLAVRTGAARASSRSWSPPTSPASGSRACSSRTGRSSSPRARPPGTSATCSPWSRPRQERPRGRRPPWSRSTTRSWSR
jgi:aerobic-type carbon monoxide dehydrogenase small subunit (CoxS/CutS family)